MGRGGFVIVHASRWPVLVIPIESFYLPEYSAATKSRHNQRSDRQTTVQQGKNLFYGQRGQGIQEVKYETGPKEKYSYQN
jgi:hypothetical protein